MSKIWYNVNLPPKIVWQASQEVGMPATYRQLIVAGAPTYPKVYGNVNAFPRETFNAAEEALFPRDWRLLIETQQNQGLPDVPPVTLNPTSAAYAGGGGGSSFTVTMTGPGVSGTWTVTKDSIAWLNVISPQDPQASDGVVQYLVGGTTVARVGHLYVNGQTFTVNQTYP